MAAATTTPSGAASAILAHSSPAYTFRFTPFLRQTYQVGLPADRPACRAFQTGNCPNGTRCSERHVSAPTTAADGSTIAPPRGGGLNSLVCKHWLRGLCKKGEHCEFLHEYNLRKMPECNFFMRNGYCSNGDECLYLHVDPMSRLPPCPHYDAGFCPLGPRCSKKHVRRRLCPLYIAGFCPDGPACRAGAHPRWRREGDLPRPRARSEELREQEAHAAAAAAAAPTPQREDTPVREDMGGVPGLGGPPQGGFDGGRFGGGRGRGGGGGKWRGGRGRFRGRH